MVGCPFALPVDAEAGAIVWGVFVCVQASMASTGLRPGPLIWFVQRPKESKLAVTAKARVRGGPGSSIVEAAKGRRGLRLTHTPEAFKLRTLATMPPSRINSYR